MTWGVGFISQWPILLLQGLEMTGKKYDLHLHVDATAEKLSMNCCKETKRSVEKKHFGDSHGPGQEEDDEHRSSQQQQRSGCTHHGNLV